MTVMINYLYNHCQGDPVLKAVRRVTTCMGPYERLARLKHQWLLRLNAA